MRRLVYHGSITSYRFRFSLTHSTLLLTQPPTSPQSSLPICVRVLVQLVGVVGTVEKVFFLYFQLILVTEHLIVLVHDIFYRGFVHELVDHYGDHVSERVRVKTNF
jgi:hypothetical protein